MSDQSGTPNDPLPSGEISIPDAVLEKLPKEERDKILQMAVLSTSELFVGPLPPPQLFQAYEKAFPGSAKIILEMAQAEQKHRHSLDRAEVMTERLGLGATLVLGLPIVIGGIHLINVGRDVAGLGIIAGGIATVAGALFYTQSRKSRRRRPRRSSESETDDSDSDRSER
jgi:uncharacterized membrane protein